ncbi:MAG: hypothetical protein ABSB74_18555 [Tepidisphaeraceae bacterium]
MTAQVGRNAYAGIGIWSNRTEGAQMLQQPHIFPPMPDIGKSESHYAELARQADADGNIYAQHAAKVGQYITLALDQHLDWPAKLRYFQHALKRHCVPPPVPDEPVWIFYRDLADLVRRYAGHEALRLSSIEDDLYATRLALGADREAVESDAENFFAQLLGVGEKRPDWVSEEDWLQLKMIRDQWI